ncbi:universal stress protein [Gulosibacter sp. 10]|uniref:universal stress protein n=1 Tax=Gulosibacter sp. 10 TaxID=1255570 RepID=UPI00097ED54A|nr:universal stress protein [Gulosibacter sp. 10]SJM62919.1 UspA domain protein [Gulosibacter sp. 10]
MPPSPRPRERLIVGYVADARGRDALELACYLGEGKHYEIVLVMVMPDTRALGANRAQLKLWEEQALSKVPEGVVARFEVRQGVNEARGLLDAAEDNAAQLIVVGAATGRILRSFSVGSTANALLHSSPVPVALAPRGFRNPGVPLERLTGIYGTRPGSEVVIGRTVERAIDRDIRARLISLVQVDLIDPKDIRDITDEARAFGGRHLEDAAEGMLESGRVTIEIAEGRDLEDAIATIEWDPHEVALLGSSRLGGNRSVFLGQRAARILRALRVPVIVIPSGYRGVEPIDSDA